MPRGTLHYATTGEEGSIHIAVGYHPITWGQLIQLAVKHAKRTARGFRKTVSPHPLRELDQNGNGLAAAFGRLLPALDLTSGIATATPALAAAFPRPPAGPCPTLFERRE
jgi:hypothetical protein